MAGPDNPGPAGRLFKRLKAAFAEGFDVKDFWEGFA